MKQIILIAALLSTAASAQWQLQNSHSTANLSGIDNVSGDTAWASGSNGTVIRTIDGGVHWQLCSIPLSGEKLDFRSVQAFDAKTAVVMSSGSGDLSRLYATTDGCRTWKLLLTNPEPQGSFDSLQYDRAVPLTKSNMLVLVGEPLEGRFPIWDIKASQKQGHDRVFKTHRRAKLLSPHAKPGQTASASSSTFKLLGVDGVILAVGGTQGAGVFSPAAGDGCCPEFEFRIAPVGDGAATSGIASLALDENEKLTRKGRPVPAVAVGGDSTKPDSIEHTAAYADYMGFGVEKDGWHPAETMPQGYRSAVAYDATHKTWITVGPNGTDISTDNGHTWQSLKPSPTDSSGADSNWNALSLPYVVGPHGRVGKFNRTPAP